MVKEIRIYIEGGGDKKDTKKAIRIGFSEFLKDLRQIAQKKKSVGKSLFVVLVKMLLKTLKML